jgi:hypothetical protein
MWSSFQIWLVIFHSCLVQCSPIILSFPHSILYMKFRHGPVTCWGTDLILYVVFEIFFDDDCNVVVLLTSWAVEGLWQSVCIISWLGIVAFHVYMCELVLYRSRVPSLTVLMCPFCSYLKWMHNGEHECVWVMSPTFTRAFPIVTILKQTLCSRSY